MAEPVTQGTSDTFIRLVAHDLRASLNAVVGWGELVKAGQLSPDDSVRAGETIVRHARHLSQRLNDALDLWRLDLGVMTLARRDASVGTAVRAAIDSARQQLDARRLEVAIDLQADEPVHVDSSRLVQALVLLLQDVAANTPAGHRVDVTTTSHDAQVEIRIVGEGLMPDDGAVSAHRAEAGTGDARRPFDFGLTLARALIVLHGGTFDAARLDGGRIAFIVGLATTTARPTS